MRLRLAAVECLPAVPDGTQSPRAPRTRIRSWLSATCSAGDCVSVLVAMLIVSPSVKRPAFAVSDDAGDEAHLCLPQPRTTAFLPPAFVSAPVLAARRQAGRHGTRPCLRPRRHARRVVASSAAHASSGSRCSSASTRAKPPFAPSSTPYCIVVLRSSVVAKRIVCVSFVRSPRSSNSSVCRWFWNVCTSRSGASTSRNSPSTTPKAVRKRYVPPGLTSISSTTVPSPHHSGISFGSVQTEKTCARGASKVRSTRISSSFGVVTVVVFIVLLRSSADGLLYKRGDLLLVGRGQVRQREGGRPHGALVEV